MTDGLEGLISQDRQASFERDVMDDKNWQFDDDWYIDPSILDRIAEIEYRMYEKDCFEVYREDE